LVRFEPTREPQGCTTPQGDKEYLSIERTLVLAGGRDAKATVGSAQSFTKPTYVEFLGLTPEEIRGRHASEVLGPELYGLNRRHIERALAGEPCVFERSIIDPSGAHRHLQEVYVPDLVDGEVCGLIALVSDITARQVAEQARFAADARFRLAFVHASVGMAMMDSAGRLLQVNPMLCTMLGYSEDELLGSAFADLVGPARQHEVRDRIARLFSGEPEASSASRWLRVEGCDVSPSLRPICLH
jgi:PAS domain S-box-containing protein